VKKLQFWIKQLLPLMYVSEYSENGHRKVTVWRQWFGRPFKIRTWEIRPS
jgi:hypothetical protein